MIYSDIWLLLKDLASTLCKIDAPMMPDTLSEKPFISAIFHVL